MTVFVDDMNMNKFDGWMDKTMLQGGRKMMITLVVDNNIINPVILVIYIK